MSWKIPLADLDLGSEEEAAALAVLRRRWLTMGSETQAFEAEFAAFIGAKHALAVTNCTAALHLACIALGIGPGDEVIVPSLTFVATANAVRYVGATPVFADIVGETDFSLDPDDIVTKITPQTKAIIVVHYAGYACDMPAIIAIAERHGLQIIEDVAHAPGASLADRALGTWGAIGCFSFFSNKNMTTGEGGMLITEDDELAEKLRYLRSHGMTTLTWDRHQGHAFTYDVVDSGYNFRIDEIRAAIGRIQLRKLPANNARRAELNQRYVDGLTELVPQVTVPYKRCRGEAAYHIRPILLPPTVDRSRFMTALKTQGIQTSIHYPPIHQFWYYRQATAFNSPNLPMTDDIAAREVTLPLYPGLSFAQVDDIITAVHTALAA
ncbi:MAG: DegT/DnrJ/EryC1/StrS family aminotransferase [Anaerolineae bacterium]|nr:DegT/DnrJ/EryC1/StrS family aminotransferase [Anaerolineae bacterium]MCO5194754.1 DegT/DnrJ/EryC1/StrS family aminotransferase [Anaerolineae bacterium]